MFLSLELPTVDSKHWQGAQLRALLWLSPPVSPEVFSLPIYFLYGRPHNPRRVSENTSLQVSSDRGIPNVMKAISRVVFIPLLVLGLCYPHCAPAFQDICVECP